MRLRADYTVRAIACKTAIPMRENSARISPAGRERRIVTLWLLAVAALVVATLLVGGATRLTESGLSIVEWKPVTGTLPPLSQDAWQAEFEKYKTIPQYRELNRGMSLDQFKTIYWWEWAHRLLGRADRRGVPAAVSLFSLARLDRGRIARAALDDLRARRGAGRGRLVDGVVGTDRAGQRLAIPAGVSSHARLRDLCARSSGRLQRLWTLGQHAGDVAPAR